MKLRDDRQNQSSNFSVSKMFLVLQMKVLEMASISNLDLIINYETPTMLMLNNLLNFHCPIHNKLYWTILYLHTTTVHSYGEPDHFGWTRADTIIVAGTAGTPEEPHKRNTLKIRILFASQWGAWGTVRHYSHVCHTEVPIPIYTVSDFHFEPSVQNI